MYRKLANKILKLANSLSRSSKRSLLIVTDCLIFSLTIYLAFSLRFNLSLEYQQIRPFLGEILTNLPLEPDRPHSAHCRSCSRCLSACPTQAIVSPSVVDANRCIAYHTIENRAVTLPTEIAENLQGWVAGCDICQDVSWQTGEVFTPLDAIGQWLKQGLARDNSRLKD